MTHDLEAFFTRDGDTLVPGSLARGPWGDTIGGHIIGGAVAWVAEQAGGDPQLQPARLTVDLLRPMAIRPVQFEASVRRSGRRIRVVDTELHQDGIPVARASVLLIRRSQRPEGDVWTPPLEMPPLPDETTPAMRDAPFILWAFGDDWESGTLGGGTAWEQDRHRNFAWIRQIRPLIEGDVLTPFVRAALAADLTSAVTHWGTTGLRYINADFTLTLSRLPDGEYIGLASDGHHDADGVATGAATVFDQHGALGNSIAVALAQGGDPARLTGESTPRSEPTRGTHG